MSDAMKDAATANDLLKNSSLYREFQAEREEILRHKIIDGRVLLAWLRLRCLLAGRPAA